MRRGSRGGCRRDKMVGGSESRGEEFMGGRRYDNIRSDRIGEEGGDFWDVINVLIRNQTLFCQGDMPALTYF